MQKAECKKMLRALAPNDFRTLSRVALRHRDCVRTGMIKPYDIKERAFLFSCDAMRAYPNEALDPRAHHAWVQFLRAATSGGAHLEEAEAAASRAHFVTLSRGALRELREANYWVRLIGATKLRGWEKTPPLSVESSELIAIITTIVKKASVKLRLSAIRPAD
jgi:four helix bundle protein